MTAYLLDIPRALDRLLQQRSVFVITKESRTRGHCVQASSAGEFAAVAAREALATRSCASSAKGARSALGAESDRAVPDAGEIALASRCTTGEAAAE
jgi:hypothetical protein